MKNILLITLYSFLCCNMIWGQCTPLQVSTDPQNSFNEELIEDPITGNINPFYINHLNNFDWQSDPYNPVNYVPNGVLLGTVQSPFTNTGNINFNRLSTDSGIKDYYVEDGWELLNENITNTNATDVIYFTLYNLRFAKNWRVKKKNRI